MQLSQMFVGVFINVMAYMQQGSCKVRVDLLQAAAVMYASYAILFLNFLYHRYIKKKQWQHDCFLFHELVWLGQDFFSTKLIYLYSEIFNMTKLMLLDQIAGRGLWYT